MSFLAFGMLVHGGKNTPGWIHKRAELTTTWGSSINITLVLSVKLLPHAHGTSNMPTNLSAIVPSAAAKF